MSTFWIDALGYAALTIMGLYFIARHQRLGYLAHKFQKDTFKIRLDEKWIKWNGIGYLIVGIGFVTLSLIELLKILQK